MPPDVTGQKLADMGKLPSLVCRNPPDRGTPNSSGRRTDGRLAL